METSGRKIYRFDSFCFDPQARALTNRGTPVSLAPKSLEILRELLDRKAEVISREHLLESIWSERFVEDANLTVAVSVLRKTLEKFEPERIYIQTVPKRGYRFVGNVEEVIESHDTTASAGQYTMHPARPRSALTFRLIIAALILAALVTTGIWSFAPVSSALGSASPDPQAVEAFERGEAVLNRRAVCESIPHFREAVAHDAQYARAHSSLASALAMCGVTDEAEQAIVTALTLDSTLAEAHATHGFIQMFVRWEWPEAEASLRRAITLDANSAKSHHWLAVNLSIRGKFSEAIDGEMKRAIELEPDSALFRADRCQMLYLNRRFGQAVAECEYALTLDPNLFLAAFYLRDLYLVTGDEAKAIEWQLRAAKMLGGIPELINEEEQVLRSHGYAEWTRRRLDALFEQRTAKSGFYATAAFDAVTHYATLRDKENTLTWLERTLSCTDCVRPFWLPYVALDPRYDFLRGDERFNSIIRQMNLVPLG